MQHEVLVLGTKDAVTKLQHPLSLPPTAAVVAAVARPTAICRIRRAAQQRNNRAAAAASPRSMKHDLPGRMEQPSVAGSVRQALLLLALNPFVLGLLLVATPTMGQASATATSSETFFQALTDNNVTLILIPASNFQLQPSDW